MALGSVEDSVVTKLKLDELQAAEKITALINYFNAVITGQTKTNPVELKAVLNLLREYQDQDKNQAILGYINTHQISINHFFSDNMQRFDRFEFKPYFLRLKGIEPGKEFVVPITAKRNFEKIQPLDIRPYKNLLEWDQRSLRLNQEKPQKADAYALEALRAEEGKKITARINELQQKIAQEMQSGRLTREKALEQLRFVEELFIPELQIRYNEPALTRLSELFLDGAQQPAVEEVMTSLKMPPKQQDLFIGALTKKFA